MEMGVEAGMGKNEKDERVEMRWCLWGNWEMEQRQRKNICNGA